MKSYTKAKIFYFVINSIHSWFSLLYLLAGIFQDTLKAADTLIHLKLLYVFSSKSLSQVLQIRLWFIWLFYCIYVLFYSTFLSLFCMLLSECWYNDFLSRNLKRITVINLYCLKYFNKILLLLCKRIFTCLL